MNDTNSSTDGAKEQADLDSALDKFETFLDGSDKAGEKKPTLRENWICLQVFATYGIRLPHTHASVQDNLLLKDAEIGDFTWFNEMVGAYGDLNKSSVYL